MVREPCPLPWRAVRAVVPIIVASRLLQRRAIDGRPQPLVLLPLLIDLEVRGERPVSRGRPPQPDKLEKATHFFLQHLDPLLLPSNRLPQL